MQIEVRNIKSFRGHDSEPLAQGTLYINGVNRGFVSDDSHGGMFRIDDHKAREEVTAYAKQFPDEFEFEQGERLVQTIMYRAVEAKRLGAAFDKSLCFLGTNGKIGMTKSIKGDVAKIRAAWIADPKTKTQLKVARFLTDKNEFLELVFAESPSLQHPALEVKAVIKKLPGRLEDSIVNRPVTTDKVLVDQINAALKAPQSKFDLCKAFYNDPVNVNMTRKDLIALFVEECNCTPAGAATYYQKLKTS